LDRLDVVYGVNELGTSSLAASSHRLALFVLPPDGRLTLFAGHYRRALPPYGNAGFSDPAE
jgi:hypothetical protein